MRATCEYLCRLSVFAGYLLVFGRFFRNRSGLGTLGLLLCNCHHLHEPIHIQNVQGEIENENCGGPKHRCHMCHTVHVVSYKTHSVEPPRNSHQEKRDKQENTVDEDDLIWDHPRGKARGEPVDVDKWCAQLEKQESWHPRHAIWLDQGHGKHIQGSERMQQEPHAKQADIHQAHDQVPNKVAYGDGSDKTRVGVIAKDGTVRVRGPVLEMFMAPSWNERYN